MPSASEIFANESMLLHPFQNPYQVAFKTRMLVPYVV